MSEFQFDSINFRDVVTYVALNFAVLATTPPKIKNVRETLAGKNWKSAVAG